MSEFVFTRDEIDGVLRRIESIGLTEREQVVLLAMIDAVAQAAHAAVGQDAPPLVKLEEDDDLNRKGRVLAADGELRSLVDEFHNSFGPGAQPIVSWIKIGPGFPCP
jgi:hypothetical protein